MVKIGGEEASDFLLELGIGDGEEYRSLFAIVRIGRGLLLVVFF